jgi:hypothetical protein
MHEYIVRNSEENSSRRHWSRFFLVGSLVFREFRAAFRTLLSTPGQGLHWGPVTTAWARGSHAYPAVFGACHAVRHQSRGVDDAHTHLRWHPIAALAVMAVSRIILMVVRVSVQFCINIPEPISPHAHGLHRCKQSARRRKIAAAGHATFAGGPSF